MEIYSVMWIFAGFLWLGTSNDSWDVNDSNFRRFRL